MLKVCHSPARGPSRIAKRRALIGLLAVLMAEVLSTGSSHAQNETSSFLIVVHPGFKQESLKREVVADALLKKQTRWDDGTLIQPVDLHVQSAARQSFSSAVLKRSVAAVRSYWQQRIFSGRGVPPPEVNSDEAVVEYVTSHAGGIGYVSRKAEVKGVRVVTLRD